MQTNKSILMAWLVAMVMSLQALGQKQANEPFTPGYLEEIPVGAKPLSPDIENLIIVVHGWNVRNVPHMYIYELGDLVKRFRQTLGGTGWGLITYPWEKDAATGNTSRNDTIPYFSAVTSAAAAADAHGRHLSRLLVNDHKKLKRVILVCHGVGVWVGYRTVGMLMRHTESVAAELVMLDAFYPGDIPGNPTKTYFTRSRISALHEFGDRVRIHNYYSPDGWEPLQKWFDRKLPDDQIKLTLGKKFDDWPESSPQVRVSNPDGGHGMFGAPSGSIAFYTDTIGAVTLTIPKE